LRRQTVLGGALSVEAGRARLDPLALPVRFAASDAAADGRVRVVEIDRDRVVLWRSLRGMAMRVTLPISAYLGVAVRPLSDDGGGIRLALQLEHRDPALSLELMVASDTRTLVAEWRLWSDVLALPLLISDIAGRLRDPLAPLAKLGSGRPCPRRRRRNAINKRRPSLPLRRRPGIAANATKLYREREIIARD
jgi:hypothetical protein